MCPLYQSKRIILLAIWVALLPLSIGYMCSSDPFVILYYNGYISTVLACSTWRPRIPPRTCYDPPPPPPDFALVSRSLRLFSANTNVKTMWSNMFIPAAWTSSRAFCFFVKWCARWNSAITVLFSSVVTNSILWCQRRGYRWGGEQAHLGIVHPHRA